MFKLRNWGDFVEDANVVPQYTNTVEHKYTKATVFLNN
jgi:hypothetical protein